EEVRRVSVRSGRRPVRNLNELEYIEGEVWANVWKKNLIARIDPETGRVSAWVDLTGLMDFEPRRNSDAVLNGIAYDPARKRLFVTGKLWPTLYEIRVLAK
ncbi:MAG TPA: glutaminyl-peptide cyclotransferase, partial [Planctomycetaceae bacterium]|nr:glutaminyl-peptide cyclotransferase [Planctomycetaceae bacterium]